jgi:hypothetical protein
VVFLNYFSEDDECYDFQDEDFNFEHLLFYSRDWCYQYIISIIKFYTIRMSSKILSDGKKTCIRLIKTRSRMNWGQRQDTHYKRHNIYNFYTTLKTKNWITLTSIKTRGEIRCPIANTMVKHTKKAKLNIMHMTVNFWAFFSDRQNIFRSDKIFMSVSPNNLTTSQQVSGSLYYRGVSIIKI